MELAPLFEMLVKTYGPIAGIFAIMFWTILALARKYDGVMQARADEGVKMALALQQLTQTIEALRDLIRDRKP